MPSVTGAAPAPRGGAPGGRWIAAALVAALALRLAFGLGYWVGKPLTLDEQEYLLLAHNVANGLGFSYASPSSGQVEGRHVGRAPMYPWFLAAVGWAVPSGAIRAARLPAAVPAEVKAAQALLGCGLVWLIAWWARRTAGGAAAVAAAFVAALYPPLVWVGAYALSESLYSLLAFSAALLIDRACAGRGSRRAGWLALAGGLVTGAAVLTRPASLLFVTLIGAWLIVRRRPGVLLAVALGAALVVAPWTVRNELVYGRFVLVASEGGVTFWTGNNRLARGEGDLAANPEMKRAALDIERAAGPATPEALEGIFYRKALEDIRSDPMRWIGLLGRKAIYTVIPGGPSYSLHSTRYVVTSVVPYLVVLPIAVAGLWRLRRSPDQPAALWLLAASSALVCVLFFPQERFRVPVIDPVLIVCASACASLAWPNRRTLEAVR